MLVEPHSTGGPEYAVLGDGSVPRPPPEMGVLSTGLVSAAPNCEKRVGLDA